MKNLMGAVALGTAFLITAPVQATTISLHSSNVGIDTLAYDVDSTNHTIEIWEDWDSSGPGVLLFSGFDYSTWTVTKHITNNSGTDWNRLANELLDPLGDGDDGLDPTPYPGHVPAGFSTSNDADGLTFGTPRSADVWSDIYVDEITHARDFNDYYNGVLVDGGTATITTELYTLWNNADFLWMQRPNTFSSVPAPASLVLLGIGLAGLGFTRRKV